jgi:hypothetical protein
MLRALQQGTFVHRVGIRDFLLGIVIIAVSISPEIPVPIIPAVDFTLRLEDILISIFIPTWFLLSGDSILILRLYRYFLAYIILALAISIVGSVLNELFLIRSVFYLLKQLEVMIIGVFVSVVAKYDRNLKSIIDLLIFAALINSIWALYQIGTGDFGPLFYTAEIDKWRYGTSLIGQPAVLSSGAYYIPAICLSTANILTQNRRKYKMMYFFLLILFFIAMGGSVSRASILGSLGAVTVLVFTFSGISLRRRIHYVIFSITFSGLFLYLIGNYTRIAVIGRFMKASQGVQVRVTQWVLIFQNGFPQILIGYGAASISLLSNQQESHNFFIRTIAVAGVPGFILFITLILTICRSSFYLVNNGSSHYQKTIAMTALGVTVGYSIVALFQDAFVNVKIAEMFWISIGAMGAGLISHINDQS